MLQYVTATLTAEPALLESVYNLMMAGVLENRVEGTDPQRFHRSAVRWTDLSVKTMVGLFTTLDSEVDAIRLTTALGSRKLETLKVLIF